MSRVSIDCPHCGQTTRIDLAFNLSTQKCDRCGVAFRAVNTGLAGSRENQPTEPPDWRRAKTGAWEEESEEATTPAPAAKTPSRLAWIFVAATLAAVAATAMVIARRPPAGPTVKPISDSGTFLASTPATPGAATGLRERIEVAAALATQYLSSTTVDEVLALVENREALEPSIRTFYREGEGQSHLPFPPFTLAPFDRHVWVDALQAVLISYTTPGQVRRAVAVRPQPDGQWLVEWPSAAPFNEVPLAQFRAQRDTTPRLFRMLAIRDDYYNRAFANDQEWVCLRLSDVTLEHSIYAYAPRQSPLGKKILQATPPRESTSAPARFRVRFPENAPADDQVEITDFPGPGWMESPLPSDPPPAEPPAPR